MHRFFEIDDVVLEVLKISSTGNCLQLGLTCQSLWEVVKPVLWGNQDVTTSMLSALLPLDLHLRGNVNDGYHLSRSMTDAEWARVEQYEAHIHSMSLTDHLSSTDTWAWRPRTPDHDRPDTWAWRTRTQDHDRHIRAFVPPHPLYGVYNNGRYLRIQVNEKLFLCAAVSKAWPRAHSLFDNLRQVTLRAAFIHEAVLQAFDVFFRPQVTKFSLRYNIDKNNPGGGLAADGPRWSEYGSELQVILRRGLALEIFDLSCQDAHACAMLDTHFLSGLQQMPKLRSLKILTSSEVKGIDFMHAASCTPFLETLQICLTSAQEPSHNMEWPLMSFTSLQSLVVTFGGERPLCEAPVTDLFQHITSACLMRLDFVTLTPELWTAAASSLEGTPSRVALPALPRFERLQYLDLEYNPAAGPEDAAKIVLACPTLIGLRITESDCWPQRAFIITHTQLLSLFCGCTTLQLLGLPANLTITDHLEDGHDDLCSTSNRLMGLRHLSVHCHTLSGEISSAARSLRAACPRLIRFDSVLSLEEGVGEVDGRDLTEAKVFAYFERGRRDEKLLQSLGINCLVGRRCGRPQPSTFEDIFLAAMDNSRSMESCQ